MPLGHRLNATLQRLLVEQSGETDGCTDVVCRALGRKLMHVPNSRLRVGKRHLSSAQRPRRRYRPVVVFTGPRSRIDVFSQLRNRRSVKNNSQGNLHLQLLAQARDDLDCEQ